MKTLKAIDLVTQSNAEELLSKEYQGRVYLLNRAVSRVERVGEYLNIWYTDGGYSAYKPLDIELELTCSDSERSES